MATGTSTGSEGAKDPIQLMQGRGIGLKDEGWQMVRQRSVPSKGMGSGREGMHLGEASGSRLSVLKKVNCDQAPDVAFGLEFSRYFEGLLGSEGPDRLSLDPVIVRRGPILTAEQQRRLVLPYTIQDVKTALNSI
ncbi:hypothetical protein Dimus_030579 [Dionaea muscipula]